MNNFTSRLIMDKILECKKDMKDLYNQCYKYFLEEDLSKDSDNHERLALKISTDGLQTLGFLLSKIEEYEKINS